MEVPSVEVEEVVEEQVEHVEAWAASSEHEVEEEVEVEEGSQALHEVQCQPTSPRSKPTEPGTGRQAAGAGHRRHGAFLSIMLENLLKIFFLRQPTLQCLQCQAPASPEMCALRSA